MDRTDIILFVVFLAYWLVSLLAKKFMKKQKTTEKKGFTVRVLEFIAALNDASEKKQNQIESQMYGYVPVEPQPVALTVKRKEAVAPPAGDQPAMKSTAKPIKEASYKKRAVVPQSPVRVPRKKRLEKKFPQQKLRDAIVWSEILGPPVGLRDN